MTGARVAGGRRRSGRWVFRLLSLSMSMRWHLEDMRARAPQRGPVAAPLALRARVAGSQSVLASILGRLLVGFGLLAAVDAVLRADLVGLVLAGGVLGVLGVRRVRRGAALVRAVRGDAGQSFADIGRAGR